MAYVRGFRSLWPLCFAACFVDQPTGIASAGTESSGPSTASSGPATSPTGGPASESDPSGMTSSPTSGPSSGPTSEPPTSGSSDETSVDPGCQMEMSGDDVRLFVRNRSGRSPSIGETVRERLQLGHAASVSRDAFAVPEAIPFGGTSSFITDPDGGTGPTECDVWTQDCPPGEKCMPWADDGSSAWNATRCSPIADEPDEVGETCTVEGSGVSGVDSCNISQMCWNVDNKTNEGVCVAFCTGAPAMPMCADPATACSISNQDVLILCLPLCNPLEPGDCEPDEGCYPSGDAFHCSPDASDGGTAGAPCEFLNACEAGEYCAPGEDVPGCTSAGCCSPFCEVGDDTLCLDGQTCVPWYDPPGSAPDPCLEDVGACVEV